MKKATCPEPVSLNSGQVMRRTSETRMDQDGRRSRSKVFSSMRYYAQEHRTKVQYSHVRGR